MSEEEIELIRGALQWTFHGIGEGFTQPEDMFWNYSKAVDDDDWETLADRIADKVAAL